LLKFIDLPSSLWSLKVASVNCNDVRDVLNLASADIPDSKVPKMTKRAEVTLEVELSKSIDYANCSEVEKEAITVLAAIYAICYLSGTAIGMNFSLGDQYINVLMKASSLHMSEDQLSKLLENLKRPYVGLIEHLDR